MHLRRCAARSQHVVDPRFFEEANLRRVAKWFYVEELTKRFIRERLQEESGQRVEIRNIDTMLLKARRQGIVVIDFPEKHSPQRLLEDQLKDKFDHLQRVIVIPTKDGQKYSELLMRWGEAAAEYFEELVSESKELHVGISGGETLLSFANAVTEFPRKQVHIHTAALIGRGRLPDKASHVDPLVNATILWTKCGRVPGHCHYATVPPYDALMREDIAAELHDLSERQPIREVILDMNKINVAFAGLGLAKATAPDPERLNQLTMTGLLEPMITPDTLAKEGAMGDLAYCLFDKNGKGRKEWEFFLTAGYRDPERRGIEFYRKMVADKREKKKVVVIAGSLKQEAIRAALNAQLFNVWITDQDAAQWVLENA